MGHLLRDLEFFCRTFKTSSEYDNTAGDYREETAEETEYDARFLSDTGGGKIKETAGDFTSYRLAMDNFQLGFDKTENQIEEIWKDVDVGRGSLVMPKWVADSLERGRKAAAHE